MTSKHHEIEIAPNGNGVTLVRAMPELAVGDTVRYFCNSKGQLSITFPELSPYDPDATRKNSRVRGNEQLTVRRSGTFKSGCRFKPDGKDEMGWPDDPESGADVVIKNLAAPPGG